jgi:hypothetical protein
VRSLQGYARRSVLKVQRNMYNAFLNTHYFLLQAEGGYLSSWSFAGVLSLRRALW